MSQDQKTSEKGPSLAETRYESEHGRVFLSGMQALVRLPIVQMKRDAAAGLRTQAFITGYPGSPLGGYDIALKQAGATLEKYRIKHVPGQNEELAATALTGTQMLDGFPHPDVDGVVGFWYGKGPGIDRSSDAIKHGNFGGTSKHGAVVILSGEDHEAKSSSVPYQQEFAFEHYGVPVLYPASITEFLQFGLHAVALSRFSGCWVALKLVAPVCDGGEVVDLNDEQTPIIFPQVMIDGKPFSKSTNFTYFPVMNVATEHKLYAERHKAVVEYARANELNKLILAGKGDKIGIIAAGKSFADTRQALYDLGFDDASLSAAGIRLAKVGLLCPSETEFFRAFGDGLEHIIVVEEKRDFLERQVASALCGHSHARVVGKCDLDGAVLFPVAGGMDVDQVAQGLGAELSRRIALPKAGADRLKRIEVIRSLGVPALPKRTPNYCSGCPHNVSTKLAPGQTAWGAPGCHVFAALMEQPERRIEAMTQFGGEGMPWIGLSPYTSKKHIVQNVGDGSLFHSSLHNIRFAVSTKQTMTFRILYNGVVANTGGQEAVGKSPVIDLVQRLAADGVTKIVLVARDASVYKGHKLPSIVSLREPNEVQTAMGELEKVDGVTVLIYDGDCANERRRREKRGRLPPPTKFTVVNEDVCENCGDCGRKANCMSLQKVPTEFGLKTQIHQSSCNHDQSCVEGECPSFVSVKVEPGTAYARPKMPEIGADIAPAALPVLSKPYHIYIPGVGGTGVITLNAILAQAATLDGHEVKSFDQTGAAQKWGAVLSSLIIYSRDKPIESNKITLGNADLYLALDLMAATDRSNLAVCDATTTTAVINTDVLPTGEMIRNVRTIISPDAMADVITTRTLATAAICVPARKTAETLFGDYMMANMVAVGAAYQAGLIPITSENIEKAIVLNGAAAKANIVAFRAGRISQSDPVRFANLLRSDYRTLADRLANKSRTSTAASKARLEQTMATLPHLSASLLSLAKVLVSDLIDYQNESYARRFTGAISSFADCDFVRNNPERSRLLEAAMRNLHKVMAYKDEYEVARLLTDRVFTERVKEMFPGFRSMAFNLQPPFARALGLNRKIELGTWINPMLKMLTAMRWLRATALDPFKLSKVRRDEHALVGWYIDLMKTCAKGTAGLDGKAVLEALSLPEDIRGYEHLKLESIGAARVRAEKLFRSISTSEVSKVA